MGVPSVIFLPSLLLGTHAASVRSTISAENQEERLLTCQHHPCPSSTSRSVRPPPRCAAKPFNMKGLLSYTVCRSSKGAQEADVYGHGRSEEEGDTENENENERDSEDDTSELMKEAQALGEQYRQESEETLSEWMDDLNIENENAHDMEVDADELIKEAQALAEHYRREIMETLPDDEEEAQEVKLSKKKKMSKKKLLSMPFSNKTISDQLLPKVAIVGRPNVGKSALFNRISGRSVAIVNDEPGVTRDRLYTRCFWGVKEFMIIDTGGVMTVPSTSASATDAIALRGSGGAEAVAAAVKEASAAGLPAMIERQAGIAVEEAAAVIFVVDGQAGPTAADVEIAAWLRRRHSGKTTVMAVNKCESPTRGQLLASEFWSLGFTPLAVSAVTGSGTGDLLDAVCVELPEPEAERAVGDDEEDQVLGLAIVGRPNVGKSSLVNALVGEERTIVSPISGTTRDAIDLDFTGPDGQEYKLIDTAGIRRRAAIAGNASKTEALAVNRAFRAIRRADVVALVIDAMEGVTEQDFRLGERIEAEGKACVIVVNKWDTVPDKQSNSTVVYEEDVRERLRILDWAPVLFTSATTRQRVAKILDAARAVAAERARRLSTATLNRVLQEAAAFGPSTFGRGGGKRGKIYFCTQAAVNPPTFVFFVNDAKYFGELYRRYMEKQIRTNAGFRGTPLRLLWRSKKKAVRQTGGSSSRKEKTEPVPAHDGGAHSSGD